MNKIHTAIAKALEIEVFQDERGFVCENICIFPNFEEVLTFIIVRAKVLSINLPCVLGYALTIELDVLTGWNSFHFIEYNHNEFSDSFYYESIKDGLEALERQLELEACYADIDDLPFATEA